LILSKNPICYASSSQLPANPQTAITIADRQSRQSAIRNQQSAIPYSTSAR
jgi:hypothetical protein